MQLYMCGSHVLRVFGKGLLDRFVRLVVPPVSSEPSPTPPRHPSELHPSLLPLTPSLPSPTLDCQLLENTCSAVITNTTLYSVFLRTAY